MARQESQWEEAFPFSQAATKLDPNFGDAFMGWGVCPWPPTPLTPRYQEAIATMREAVRITQGNPSAHDNTWRLL